MNVLSGLFVLLLDLGAALNHEKTTASLSEPVSINAPGGSATGGVFAHQSLVGGEGAGMISGGQFSEAPIIAGEPGERFPTLWVIN